MVSRQGAVILAFGVMFAMRLNGAAHAADHYGILSGETACIKEHGVEKNVTNNCAAKIFVPTKTAQEWNAFLNCDIAKTGGCVAIANCVSAPPAPDCSDKTCPDCCGCPAKAYYSYTRISARRYQFTDKSEGDIIQWFWDFGDGTNSSLASPLHVFPSSKTYSVKLFVKACSCSGGTPKPVWVSYTSNIPVN